MTPFDDQRSVWTDNQDPEWLARGPFNPDKPYNMLMAVGLSDRKARALCERLLILRPDLKFFVTDNHDRVTDTFDARPPIVSSAPKRRTLGGGTDRG